MRKRKQHARLSAMLALLLAAALTLGVLPAPAFAVTQGDIDRLEAEKKALEEKVSQKQAEVEELESQEADATAVKEALDERNVYLVRQIRLNDEQIALYDEMIAEKEQEVIAAKAKEDEQLQRYRRRVRAMEENGNTGLLEMLLKANNLGEFLSAMDDIGEIMKSDKLLEDAYIAARENTEQVKADYERFRAELEVKKEALEADQAVLEQEIEEAIAKLEELQKSIEERNAELEKLKEQEQDTEKRLDEANAELEEQKRREEEARAAAAAAANSGGGGGGGGSSGGVTGTGNFAWPVACTYITSMVGYRYHPISGVYKYHSGMDIGCQYGDAVWASDAGTVILAGVNGGYGNCIMIDHGYVNGDNYVTLYGHLSSIGVSVGQSVSQGEIIGEVGSTGVSTGPHLHFEIRNSSGPTDFSWRFSGLTYSPDSGG